METVTAELLERIAARRRFSAQTLEIARRLYLYGDPPRGLSAQYGVNLARIYAIRDAVSQAAKEMRLPPGWEEVTLVAPKELIEAFRLRVAQAREELNSGSGTAGAGPGAVETADGAALRAGSELPASTAAGEPG
jgi:hypothetical protein